MRIHLSYLTSVYTYVIWSQLMKITLSSADQPRTLAFIFDVTYSMIVDLEHVKIATEAILKKIPYELDQYFGEYMFMPFHDPAVGMPLVTENKTDFFQIIKMHYGTPMPQNVDCEEMALPALYTALHYVTPRSYIVVFTDDNSKHTSLLQGILNITTIQRPTISFVITPGCNFGNNDLEYEAIANKTGGQIYEVVKKNVSTLTYALHEHWKSDWFELKSLDFPYGGSHAIRMEFRNLSKVLVSFTGKNARVKMIDVNRKEEIGKRTVDMQNVQEIVLENPVSGVWTLELYADAHHRLRVLAVEADLVSSAYLGLFVAYCLAIGLMLSLCLYNYKFILESVTKCWESRPPLPQWMRFR